MYDLYHKLECYNAIIILGASDLGYLLYDELKSYCRNTGKVLCFADNSYKKWDEKECVLRPADAAAKHPGALWIIASDMHGDHMASGLHELHIEEKNIYKGLPPSILRQKKSAEIIKRTTSQGVLSRFEVDIAYHCNLNCTGCNAFSPLVNEEIFLDIEVFNRDLVRLSELLYGYLPQMYLMGGEPLLNPQINDFTSIARQHFPDTRIYIITNGILLPQMPDAFWKACNDNDISISVTRYPISFDYEKLPTLADRHGVCFEFFGIAVEKTSINYAFDCTGSQNPYDSFINCHVANMCPRLKDGKISTCPPILNAGFFNNYFGTHMDVCPDDYIDIYKAQSGREIVDFISKPVPFCRFCNVKARTYDNTWRVSTCDIGEWTMPQ